MRKHWHIILAVFLFTCSFGYFGLKLHDLEKTMKDKEYSALMLIQKLDAGITFQSKQQKHLLETRDIIMKVATSAKVEMSIDTAYQIAEANLKSSMKYGVDANLLLAIQTRESNFSTTIRSQAGAMGHNQLWEPTARMLCRILGWDYSPELCENIERSTEMAALLVQIYSASYSKYNSKCTELIVAAYNGGPRNAEYYRTRDKRLSAETAQYVPIVIRFYNEYTRLIGTYLAENSNPDSSS